MSFFIEKTPFGVLLISLIIISALCIYAYFDTERKKPGHPAKYIFLSAIPLFVVIIIDRYVYDNSNEKRILWIDLLMMIMIAFVYVTAVITFVLAHKRGYTNEKLVEQNKIILILFAVACGAVLILLGVKMLAYRA